MQFCGLFFSLYFRIHVVKHLELLEEMYIKKRGENQIMQTDCFVKKNAYGEIKKNYEKRNAFPSITFPHFI